MTTTASTRCAPVRLELTSAGMRGVIGSLAVIGFVFGMGGLAVGIDVLFGQAAEKVRWPFFFMLPVPFMFVGGGIFFTAMVFFLRRITLEADASGITRISRIFVFRRERRFCRPPLADVVYSFASGSSDALCLGKIHAAFDDGRRVLLLQRYGMTETRRLAEVLRAAVFGATDERPANTPPGGALSIVEDVGTLRLHLRPEPASRVGANSLVVSVVLLVFSTLFFAGFVIAVWQVDHTTSGRVMATAVSGGLWVLFVVVCSTMIVKTRRRAVEQADIALDSASLRIDIRRNASSPSRRLAWKQQDIRSISVEPSGLKVNDQPVFELQVVAADSAEPVRLFTGRDVRDLRWLASTLSERMALSLPAARRREVLEDPDSPIAAATLAAIDHKLKFIDWRRRFSDRGLILELPPSFNRGLGFFFFAGMWLLMSGVFIVLSLMPSTHMPLYVVPIMLAFSIPGIVLAYFARRMTQASAQVELTTAALTIHWHILKDHDVTIPCDQITGIGTTFGTSDGPLQLYVDRADGRQTISMDLSNGDLQGLAEVLGIALALPPK